MTQKPSLTLAGLKTVLTKLKTIMDQTHADINTDVSNALSGKVDVVAGKDLVPTSEIDKLALLNISQTGVISISNLPQSAVPTCKIVTSLTDMYALTTNDVQNGDTVKVEPSDGSPSTMYLVVDDTQLNVDAGYVAYTASVDWSTIQNIPTTITSPTTLEIQVDGTAIATYTGLESNTVVANIDTSSFTVDAIEDADVDALFVEIFGSSV